MRRHIIFLFCLVSFLFCIAFASAIDFTPQGDINLRDTYDIINWNISSCSAGEFVQGILSGGTWNCTSVGAVGDITGVLTPGPYLYGGCASGTCSIYENETKLNASIDARDSDTTYTAGSNMSLVGTIFSVNMTSVQNFFDSIYATISDALTSATNFGGEVSGNASNIVLDHDALDDQYVELTDLPLANQTLPHCSNVTGSAFNLCVNPDTTIGNCSGDGSCTNIIYISDLPLENQTISHCSNITGEDVCTDDDTTYSNGSGISLVGTQFNHSDTSSQSSDDNSGNTFIQDIALDALGHITSLTNAGVDFSSYVAIANLVGYVGNWSADKEDYYNKTEVYNQSEVDDINTSMGSYVDTGLAAQDECSEITNCVDNAWDADADISNDEIGEAKIVFSTACAAGNHYYLNGNDLACEADDDTTYTNGSAISLVGDQFNLTTCSDNEVWKMDGAAWNCEADDAGAGAYTFNIDGDTGTPETIDTTNVVSILGGTNGIDTVVSATDTITINVDISEIDTATPSDGDTTHLSLADEIYDWVIGLAYTPIADLVGMIGNWSADKSDYYNKTEVDVNLSLRRLDSWDNFTGIPTATPSNGDTTHLSTADEIYDWVIGLAYSAFGASVDDDEMTNEDFGEFSCDSTEDGCTLNTGAFDDEYIELGDSFSGEVSGVYGSTVVGNDVLDDQYYDSEADLTTLLDDNYEPISAAHFNATTINITCFDSACNWFTNATDSCMYWPSGGKDCGAA